MELGNVLCPFYLPITTHCNALKGGSLTQEEPKGPRKSQGSRLDPETPEPEIVVSQHK